LWLRRPALQSRSILASREEFSKAGWPKETNEAEKPSRLFFTSSAFFGNDLRGLDLIAAAPRCVGCGCRGGE
jgi:hypothetical protein